MKNLANIIIVLGFLVGVYSILGRFVGQPTIGFGVMALKAGSGINAATFIIVSGAALKFWNK